MTIDELVKGDVETMKQTIDKVKMKVWTWVMGVCMFVGLASIAPAMKYLGYGGILIPFGIMAVGCGASFAVEHIKKRNNTQTYSEILSFMEDVPRDEERITRQRQRLVSTRVFLALGSAAIAAVISAIGFIIFR